MKIIDEKLNSLLEEAGEFIKTIDEEYYMYHFTAMKTGMRKNEIFTLNERIIEINNKNIKIITEKTKKTRTIQKEKIHPIILERCKRNIKPFQKITYHTLNSALKKGGIKNIIVNGKAKKRKQTHNNIVNLI